MRILRHGLYALILLSLFHVESKAQLSERVFLKVSKIYDADKNSLLDRSMRLTDDSIQVYQIDDQYYFLYRARGIKDKSLAKLFSYNNRSEIKSITDSLFYFNDDPSSYLLRVFNNTIFYIDQSDNDLNKGKAGRLRLIVFDVCNNVIKEHICLPRDGFLRKIYAHNDNLYIIIQPVKAERNVYYYLTFWFPRGSSPKWNYIEAENKILYTFDRYFNIIKQEEIVKGDEEK
ncbi:MAG TPA: hypothetical protein VHO28_07460 [Ignavibacteriales bacterium]|nr:hypothetical protein [Ignavibacteriales bacterium]